jgi:hypothetical protein
MLFAQILETSSVRGAAEAGTLATVWQGPGWPRPPTAVAKFKVPEPPGVAAETKVQVKLTDVPTLTASATAGLGLLKLLMPAWPVGLALRLPGVMEMASAVPVSVTVPVDPVASVPAGVAVAAAPVSPVAPLLAFGCAGVIVHAVTSSIPASK